MGSGPRSATGRACRSRSPPARRPSEVTEQSGDHRPGEDRVAAEPSGDLVAVAGDEGRRVRDGRGGHDDIDPGAGPRREDPVGVQFRSPCLRVVVVAPGDDMDVCRPAGRRSPPGSARRTGAAAGDQRPPVRGGTSERAVGGAPVAAPSPPAAVLFTWCSPPQSPGTTSPCIPKAISEVTPGGSLSAPGDSPFDVP